MVNPNEIERRVVERAMATYPEIGELIVGSTPVVSFGNPEIAEVVTVGINPSSNEFLIDGAGTPLLPSGKKRLVDTEILGIDSPKRLTEDEAIKVIQGCYEYFDEESHNPYMRWFSHLNTHVNAHLGVDYLKGSAAHLDLVQWATDPVWGGIKSVDTRKALLELDAEFLRYQLNAREYKVVFMNGREVKNQLVSTGIATIEIVEEISYKTTTGKVMPIEFFKGRTSNGSLALGWSKTFPGHYLSNDALPEVVNQLHNFMNGFTR